MIIKLPRFDAVTERRFGDWRTERLRDVLPGPILVGAMALLGFSVWDWALDPAQLPMVLTVRLLAMLVMLHCAWRIGRDKRAPFGTLSFLTITTGTAAIALTQAIVTDGFVYGSAGLALFPTVSAIAVVRARDVPLLNIAPFVLVVALLWMSGVRGFAAFNVLAFLSTGIFTAYIVALALERAARQSFQLELQLEAEARLDPLTGLANRRRLEEQAATEVERTRRFARPLSLLLIDVDHFKRVNDNHGHPIGDEVLRALAGLCGTQLRQTDLLARLGGEEFVALLPETRIDDATALAERLRARVAAEAVLNHPVRLQITISIGVATYGGDIRSWDGMMAAADRAMYVAKDQGRNRVVRADTPIMVTTPIPA